MGGGEGSGKKKTKVLFGFHLLFVQERLSSSSSSGKKKEKGGTKRSFPRAPLSLPAATMTRFAKGVVKMKKARFNSYV